MTIFLHNAGTDSCTVHFYLSKTGPWERCCREIVVLKMLNSCIQRNSLGNLGSCKEVAVVWRLPEAIPLFS